MNRDSYLVEAVSGRWLRLPNSFRKASYVVDLPNGIALNVSMTSGRIEIYAEEDDQVYRFSGEMYLEADRQSVYNSTRIIYKNEPRALPGF
ncbi:hypothetical protein [Gorillibacterium sp. sgz5001074]|uniref:hypothetical protein n=1 Tax=Gorillibacterium sp. sgz5001074 TaxID=3446695 RepID=UPI003F667129